MASNDYFDPQGKRIINGTVTSYVKGDSGVASSMAKEMVDAATGYVAYQDYKLKFRS